MKTHKKPLANQKRIIQYKLYFLKFLAIMYFLGFALHLLDVFNLRINLSELNMSWKIWIFYLLVFDLLTAVFLWKKSKLGEVLFLCVASSQLIAYLGFKSFFGDQLFLVVFHCICILAYILFSLNPRRFFR